MNQEESLKNISIVAQELGLAQHVLRFWEQEFSVIKPFKRKGRRLYKTSDIALLKKIKNLLYNEGYTIKGVKKLLDKNQVKSDSEKTYRNCLKVSVSDLQEIYDFISQKYGM